MISLKQNDNYKVSVELVNAPDGEEVCFVHIDMYKMSLSVLEELYDLLDGLIKARQSQVCFYSPYTESLRLAQSLRPLDAVLDIEDSGVKAKVGIWEYETCLQ